MRCGRSRRALARRLLPVFIPVEWALESTFYASGGLLFSAVRKVTKSTAKTKVLES